MIVEMKRKEVRRGACWRMPWCGGDDDGYGDEEEGGWKRGGVAWRYSGAVARMMVTARREIGLGGFRTIP